MKKDFTAICLIAFMLFVCIACVWCLIPVFSSFATAWLFICQFVSLKILINVFKDLFNYVRKEVDKSINKNNNK